MQQPPNTHYENNVGQPTRTYSETDVPMQSKVLKNHLQGKYQAFVRLMVHYEDNNSHTNKRAIYLATSSLCTLYLTFVNGDTSGDLMVDVKEPFNLKSMFATNPDVMKFFFSQMCRRASMALPEEVINDVIEVVEGISKSILTK